MSCILSHVYYSGPDGPSKYVSVEVKGNQCRFSKMNFDTNSRTDHFNHVEDYNGDGNIDILCYNTFSRLAATIFPLVQWWSRFYHTYSLGYSARGVALRSNFGRASCQ